ncbi:MAG TPA: DUF3175 domain-containing protein [Rhizomicrobium sp.]|nr:DUF3175 domain-containing protein [Rhizomicrobium sp.]
MKTLIVEDDPVTALYVTEGLRTLGHTVYWAPTGPDGFEQARHGDCTLIIVDRMLPGLDGLSLVKQLRERNIQTPVLFLTTMENLDARIEGLNAGGDDYLTKPFALSELLARANAIICRQNHFGDTSAQTRLGAGGLRDGLSVRGEGAFLRRGTGCVRGSFRPWISTEDDPMRAKRKTKVKAKAGPQSAERYWSARVTRESDALDLRQGVFKLDDPKKIARSLKRSAEKSHRRKADPYRSALSMLTFYINRAGKNLPARRKQILQRAKAQLRKLFGKD